MIWLWLFRLRVKGLRMNHPRIQVYWSVVDSRLNFTLNINQYFTKFEYGNWTNKRWNSDQSGGWNGSFRYTAFIGLYQIPGNIFQKQSHTKTNRWSCARVQSNLVGEKQNQVYQVKLIVDTNIVFSGILSPKGMICDLLLNSDVEFQFFAPTYMLEELDTHHAKLLKLSGLVTQELDFLIHGIL